MKNFYKAVAYVLTCRAAEILKGIEPDDDYINDAANIYGDSYEEYCELADALENVF